MNTQDTLQGQSLETSEAKIETKTAEQPKEVSTVVSEKQSLSTSLSEAKKERLDKKARILEYLRRFPFYKWAAKSVGIDQSTLENWRKDDKDFSERVEIARSEGIKYFGGRATPDLILKSADPETFRERKELDITSGGKPIPIMGGTSHVHDDDSVQKDQ